MNAAANRAGLALAEEVSRYVLERFFDDDYEAFRDPSRYKSRSFTALCRRQDLAVSQASLYAMVRVGKELEALPGDVAHALSLKHHRALLPLDDAERRAELAQQAASQGWTAEELADAVRASRPPSNRGRPPLPPVVKQVRALRRALTKVPGPDAVAGLSEAFREELAASIAELEDHLASLRDALEGAA